MGLLSPTHLIIIFVIVLITFGPIALLAWILIRASRSSAVAQPPVPVAPAWLPDPTNRHELRYWDGRQWTTTVADEGRQGVDSVSV